MSARGTLSIVIQALLLTAVLAKPGWSQAGPDVFSEGVDWYRAGNYPEARRLLREYVEAHGEKRGSEAAHLGEAYHYLGLMTADARLAEGYFLAVAQRYPTSPVADESLARLGHLYAALGNYAEARKQWRALARDYPLSPFGPEVDLGVGETYFAERDWGRAHDAFSAGFSKMKTFQRTGGKGANLREIEGEYVYWLGRTLLERGAFGDARKYLNLMLLDYPNHSLEPLALYHLAESYRQEGKEKEAGEAWRRFSESVRNTSLEAIAKDPNLIAVARARETGALRRPGEAPPEGEREEVAPDVGAPAMRETPEEDETLRAPEPGRPGGVVANEPFGRRVEEPPVEKGAAEEAGAGEKPAARPERTAEKAAPPERTAEKAAPPEPAPETPDLARERQPAREAQDLEREQRVPPGEPAPAVPGVEPPGEAGAPGLQPLPTGTVYLQVGAFASAQSAGKLSTNLRKKGFQPVVHSGLVNGQGYYRVRFGPYELPRDGVLLEATRTDLRKAGFEALVMSRDPSE